MKPAVAGWTLSRTTMTYDLVVRLQAELTELVERFGGRCESWGVLH